MRLHVLFSQETYINLNMNIIFCAGWKNMDNYNYKWLITHPLESSMLRNSAVVTSENSTFRSPHPTIPPPLAGWSSSSHPKQNFAFHTCPMSSTLIPFLDRMFGVGFVYANGWDEESGCLKLSGKTKLRIISTFVAVMYMDVSENRGAPKWMVYNGKPY